MRGIKNIAILITCHNRRDKTIECLTALYKTSVPKGFCFEVFLVDDGSTDGTTITVEKHFPEVNVIQGTGKLYWNQGMRLAWSNAVNKKEYDFYLWLNDDTIININAFKDLLDCNNEAIQKNKIASIIVGCCESSEGSGKFSYGGRTELGLIIPNGIIQECTYINGNIVLIPQEVYNKLGSLSNDYTHGIGDNDYGLRAISCGYSCYTTKNYIAICDENKTIPNWCNPEVSLKIRWQSLYSPLGLNLNEYNAFRKKFWGNKWIIYAFKAYFKMLSPLLYSKISKRQ
jgi:GT2 family glycosyltransferase